MKKSTQLLTFILIVSAIAVIVLMFSRKTPVQLTTVVKTTALDAVPASVKVDPEFELTITSDVAGLVKESRLKRGQIVQKGDLLMVIDPGVYQMELARLTRELENIQAQYALNYDQKVALQQRKEDLQHFERRAANGDYPALELKRRSDEFQIFQEQQQKQQLAQEQHLANLKHSIQLQKDSMKMCEIMAPASGTVTEVYAQPGEVVSVRSALVRLFSESLLVEARINEEDFSGITIGLNANVRFLAYGTELYDAKVVKVLPNADPQNQQYRCYLQVEIDPKRLIPGLSGEASLIRNKRENALVVPRAALYNGSIFKIESNQVIEIKPSIGFTSLTAVELLNGVKEGEQIAITNLSKLRDNLEVSPQR